jgi:hypothetical protein
MAISNNFQMLPVAQNVMPVARLAQVLYLLTAQAVSIQQQEILKMLNVVARMASSKRQLHSRIA